VILASLISILVSAVLLVIVGMRDPKRLRSAGQEERGRQLPQPLSPAARRICSWLVLAPGVVLAAMGQWWAFLVWIGSACALGWATAHVLARR
jgi:hypothetical protein